MFDPVPIGDNDDVSGVLDHLATLVGSDSTSGGSNMAVVDHARDVLEPGATDVHVQAHPDGDRANLLVRFGPDAPDGVMLSAHTDCVPVTGQDWDSDPFELVTVGDRVVGRGTTDMKGFIACVLDAADELATADLAVPVFVALSWDEELGALGAEPLAEHLAGLDRPPSRAVIGEPTSMGIVNAHKSVRAYTYTFHGLGGHSSQPDGGANALRALVRLGAYVDDVAAEQRAVTDDRFEPPFTTFNLAMASAGTAINIIPDRAELTFEYRALPEVDGPDLADRIEAYARDELLADLRRTHPEARLDVVSPGVLPALHAERDGDAERLVRNVLGTGSPAETAPFGTDAARFQAVGISSVVCGPGDIAIAHRPNESVEVSQLAAGRRFVSDLVATLSN
ncbi:acetylornithine deacetylase [Salsipaludibacter albus]|uniref:acetylornithine deacetylase n=1 Tax=Salsipaludibacter albus TaxID=2849650 RepID=UPI001EE49A2A|nr:acetylornithine deacetylase [Salsipaludibacter albus]MBY5161903.1 acetylornithine deacetylase [Salsipaludibacter albus]